MHTLDLSTNKWFFIVSFFLSLALFLISQLAFELSQSFKWASFLIALFVSSILILLCMNKLFVHIDKAGISYGQVFKVKYIHQESIKSVNKKASIFGNVLQLVTRDGRVKSFYAWRLTNEELEKSKRLLNL